MKITLRRDVEFEVDTKAIHSFIAEMYPEARVTVCYSVFPVGEVNELRVKFE